MVPDDCVKAEAKRNRTNTYPASGLLSFLFLMNIAHKFNDLIPSATKKFGLPVGALQPEIGSFRKIFFSGIRPKSKILSQFGTTLAKNRPFEPA